MNKSLLTSVVLLVSLVFGGVLFAAPRSTDFSALAADARNGELTENDLQDLIGVLYTHQIDALRQIINNPNTFADFTSSSRNRAHTSTPDMLAEGEADEFGFVVVNAGNVTNEATAAAGLNAILVGSPAYDNFRGAVYLYLGGGVGEAGGVNAPITDAFDAIADKIWVGENEGDMFGYALGEDINIDALTTTDLVIGALKYGPTDRGKVYVIGGDATWTHAASAPAPVTITATAAGLADLDATITGEKDYEYFGCSFAYILDIDGVNGTGNYHLAVGAYRYSSSGDPVPEDYRGRVYLFLDSAITGDITDETDAAYIFNGRNEGDYFGYNVANAGEFVSDITNDNALLVSAHGASNFTGYVDIIADVDAAGMAAADLDFVKVVGDYAYVADNVAGGQALRVFNIGDPSNPYQTDSFTVVGNEDISFVDVSSDENFLVFGQDDQITTLDISDKFAITSHDTIDGAGNMAGPWLHAQIVGDYVVVLQADDLFSFDYTDLTSGVIGEVPIDAIADNSAVATPAGVTFTSDGTDDVYLSVNDTDATDYAGIYYVTVTSAGALEDGSGGNNLTDESDSVQLPDVANNLIYDGNVLYAELAATANENESNIVALTVVNSTNYALVAVDGLLQVWNVDTPATPVLEDEIGVGGLITSINFMTAGDIALVSYSNADGDYIASYSLYNPSNITLLDISDDLGLNGNLIDTAVIGNYLVYLASFTAAPNNRICSIDISDPYAIEGMEASTDITNAGTALANNSTTLYYSNSAGTYSATLNAVTGAITLTGTSNTNPAARSALFLQYFGGFVYVGITTNVSSLDPSTLVAVDDVAGTIGALANAGSICALFDVDGTNGRIYIYEPTTPEIEAAVFTIATGAFTALSTASTFTASATPTSFVSSGVGAAGQVYMTSEDGLVIWDNPAADLAAAPDATVAAQDLVTISISSPSNLDGKLSDTDSAEGLGGLILAGVEIPTTAQRATFAANGTQGWSLIGDTLYMGADLGAGASDVIKSWDVTDPLNVASQTDSAVMTDMASFSASSTAIGVTNTGGFEMWSLANPPVVYANSATLETVEHQIITGENTGDYFGWSVLTNAVGIDQNGESDMVITAPYAGGTRGKVYVLYQQARTDFLAYPNAAGWGVNDGMILVGANAGDFIGHKVKAGNIGDAAGGVDGDGELDLVVTSINDATNTGKVYVLYNAGLKAGSATELDITTKCDTDAEGQILEGEATNNRFGHDIAIGDFRNYQGTDDLVISAIGIDRAAADGKVYLYTNGVLANFTGTPTETYINNSVAYTPQVAIFPNNVGTADANTYDWEVDDTSAGKEATAQGGPYTHTYTSTGYYDPAMYVDATVTGFNGGASTETVYTRVDYVHIMPQLTAEAYYYHAPTALPGVYSTTPLADGDTVEVGGIIKYVATIGAAHADTDTLTWNVFSSVNNQPDTVQVAYVRPETSADIEYYWTLGTNSSVTTVHQNNNGGHGNGIIKSSLGEDLTLRFDLGSALNLQISDAYNPPAISVAAGDLDIYTANTYAGGDLLTTSSASPSVVPNTTDPLYIEITQTDGYGYGPYTMNALVYNDDTDTLLGSVELTQLAYPNENKFRGQWDLVAMGVTAPMQLEIKPELDETYSAKILYYNATNIVDNATFANASGVAYGASESETTLLGGLYIKVTGTLPANPYVYLSSHSIDTNGILVPITGELTQVAMDVASNAVATPPTIGYKVAEALYIRALSVAAGAPPATLLDNITVAAVSPTNGFGLWAPADNSMAVDINPIFRWNRYDGTQHNRALTDVTYYLLYVGTGATGAAARLDLIANMNFSGTSVVDGVTVKGQPARATRDLYAYMNTDLAVDNYVAWTVVAVSDVNDAFADGDPEALGGTTDFGAGADADPADFTYTAGGDNNFYIFRTWTGDEANGQYFPLIQGTIDHDRTLNANNTYFLCDDPAVGDGVTLTIPASTTLKFCQDATLTVNGNLLVNGANDTEVTFTTYDNATSWGGIVMPASPTTARTALVAGTDLTYTSGNYVGYAVFENAANPLTLNDDVYVIGNEIGSTNTNGIVANDGSYIMDNVIDGISGDAINGGMVINNNVIENVTGYAITASTGGSVSGNNIRNVGGHAIWDAAVINGNNVSYCVSDETLIRSSALSEFKNNGAGNETGISNNTVTGAGNALLDFTITASSAVDITANKIISNNAPYLAKVIATQVNIQDNRFESNVGSEATGAALNISTTGVSTIDGNYILYTTGSQTTGGAIYVANAAATLTMTDNIIAFNDIAQVSGSRGAGVYVNNGIVDVQSSTISYNTAAEYPAVYINSGALVTLNSNYITQNDVYSVLRATGTNYAIYGNPVALTNNYLWMNSSDVDLTASIPANANWDTDYPLNGRSYEFRYTGTTEEIAYNNCFGSRNDLGWIDPTIYDNDEDFAAGSAEGLGAVRYQPMDTDLPTTVEEVLNLFMVGSSSIEGQYQITTDDIGMVRMMATPSNPNPYSQDLAELTVTNLSQRSNGIESVVCFEDGANTEQFVGFFYVTSGASDLDRGIIHANVGDVLRVASADKPQRYIDVNVVEARLFFPEEVTIAEDESYSVNLGSYSLLPIGRSYNMEVSSADNFNVVVEQVSVDGHGTDLVATFTPAANWSGFGDFSIAVNSADGHFNLLDGLRINVTSVNDIPVAATPFNLVSNDSVAEDFEPITINLDEFFTDVEGDHISYSVTVDEDKINAKLEGNLLTLASIENLNTGVNGNTILKISATDGADREETVVDYPINIYPVNDAPVITAINTSIDSRNDELVIDEGTEVTFDAEAIDVDSEITYYWKIMTGDDYLDYVTIPDISTSYTFAERNVYTVTLVVSDGEYTAEHTMRVYSGVPAASFVQGNFPNPFNPTTAISFYLKEAGPVQVEIYNLKGQKVRTIRSEFEAGFRSIKWDGASSTGKPSASGTYFYRVSAKNVNTTKKMMLLK